MNYEALLNEIINIGSAMLQSGAESSRVEDSMYRMCRAYDEIEYCDFYAIQSNIQATIRTKEQTHFTQIRRIFSSSYNFDRLDYLNNLSREICKGHPEPDQIHQMFETVMNRKQYPPYIAYIAVILGEGGFGLYMGCDILDSIILVIISVLILVKFGNWLATKENNMFVYNLVICCLSASAVAILYRLGLPIHVDRLIPTIIFYLIGGLGITVGIRDLINKDTISGILNMVNSVVGSVAIACGIGLGLTIWHDTLNISTSLAPSLVLQTIACGIGCFGFALSYKTSLKQCISSGLGGMLTYIGYLVAMNYGMNTFISTLIASVITGLVAFILSRYHRAPSTIFLTVSALPLIPGVHLFYGMYAIVKKEYDLAQTEFFKLITLCLAIQLGFIFFDIFARYLVRFLRKFDIS